MTFSKTELTYIVAGLRMIKDGPFKDIDKLEAGMIIQKIQMDMKAHETRPERKSIELMTMSKIGENR